MRRILSLLALFLPLLVITVPEAKAQSQGCLHGLVDPNAQISSQKCKLGSGSTLDLTGVTVSGATSESVTTSTVTTTLNSNGATNIGNAATDTATVTGDFIITAAEIGFACRNESGGAFAAGDLVFVESEDSTDVPLIVLADADADKPANAVMGGSLANNTTGTCYKRIEIGSLNTSAAAADGDEVCLTVTATTGNTWAVEASCPTAATAFVQVVGFVTTDHASTGQIRFDLTSQDIRKFDYTMLQDGTDGNIPTWDANGDPAVVATGTAGHVLVSGGAGAAPTFTTLASGGITDGTLVQADESRQFATGSAPTLSACGTTPAVVGSDFAFQVTVGTGDPADCQVTFNATWTNPPVCTSNANVDMATDLFISTLSATAITVNWNDTEDLSGDTLFVMCRGRDND